METAERTRTFSRVRILGILIFVVGIIFIIRLFYLQIIQHDFYESEAIKEHTTKFTIMPNRGIIYARDGLNGKFAPLVLNEPAYTVYADPRYVKDQTKVVDVLRAVAGGNTLKGFEESLKDDKKQYVILARQINKKQADLIKAEKLAGIGLQEHEKRVYPEGKLAAQILGFVNGEGKGQYGVEQALEPDLAGTPGLLKAITDVNGIPISIGNDNVQTPARQGKDIVLTIDRNIQNYAEKALSRGLKSARATRGSVVILDPNNGHILAMSNVPSFDPNNYGGVKDYRNFGNAGISEPYEPGSVIKALTMGMGLNEGVIEPKSTYNNTGSIKVGDRTIKNVLNVLMGQVNMTQVLEFSYNTGAVHVLSQLGDGKINANARKKLYQYFTDHYFFGRNVGVDLSGESPGSIIKPSNVDNSDGGEVRYANMTFGQGMTATLLQVANAFASAVNGGVYYKPQIIAGHLKNDAIEPKQPQILKPDVINNSSSEKLRQMLTTARASFLGKGDKPGYTVGGKTGTAEVFDPSTGTYSTTQTIGSYVGFGGRTKPEYVIMVRVDDSKIGGFAGSMAAAPIFTDISNWMIDYLKIQPK